MQLRNNDNDRSLYLNTLFGVERQRCTPGYRRVAVGLVLATLATLLVFGCRKETNPSRSSTPVASAASTVVESPASAQKHATTIAPATAQPSPALTSPVGVPPRDLPLIELVQSWQDAILERDEEHLRRVYATQVTYYGQRLSREQVIAKKLQSLRKAPDFTQHLEAIRISWVLQDKPLALFKKYWKVAGKPGKVDSRLNFSLEHGQWKVAQESDVATDEMQNQLGKLSKSCEIAVTDLVLSTKAGASYRLTRGPSPNGVSLEGLDWPMAYVAIHEDDEGGLRNTVAWFTVNVATGTVYEKAPGLQANKPSLGVTDEASRRVLQRCKKP